MRQSREARIDLHDRQIVARGAGHDPAVQDAEAGRELERLRAPDGVRGGEHEPALAVDHEARAEHVVPADPGLDADDGEVHALVRVRAGRRRIGRTATASTDPDRDAGECRGGTDHRSHPDHRGDPMGVANHRTR